MPCIRKIYPMWPNKNTPKESKPLSKKLPLDLHPRIKEIIDKELEKGNEIEGVGVWPRPKSNNVYLKYRFKLEHKASGIQYHEDHDPHYLIAEYFAHETGDTVLCSIK